jgi:hypothetical protein
LFVVTFGAAALSRGGRLLVFGAVGSFFEEGGRLLVFGGVLGVPPLRAVVRLGSALASLPSPFLSPLKMFVKTFDPEKNPESLVPATVLPDLFFTCVPSLDKV